MNIGIFTDTYWPQINGIATSVLMLEHELRALGHTVHIFTVAVPKAEKRPYVYRLPSMPLSFIPSHRLCLMYPPGLLLKFRAMKLDIIHTQTEFPLGILGRLVSGFYRIPLVHTYHTMYVDYVHYIANGHLLKPKAAESYSRIFCNGAQTVITPAAKAKESLIKYSVKRPIEIIPTGFDLSRFGPERHSAADISALKRELGVPEGAKVIVTVGRVAKEKSVDVIIKALPEILKDVPDVKYVIVGGGPVMDELRDLAIRLGLSDTVIFTGPVPWDQVGKYYMVGDVFACASTSETQGLTYIEAMASGIPVAAKADDSIRELITDNETGFLFDTDDMLPGVIKKIFSDTAAARTVAERGRASVAHISAENFAKQVEAVYKRCIETRPKRTVRITMSEVFKKVATHVIDIRKR